MHPAPALAATRRTATARGGAERNPVRPHRTTPRPNGANGDHRHPVPCALSGHGGRGVAWSPGFHPGLSPVAPSGREHGTVLAPGNSHTTCLLTSETKPPSREDGGDDAFLSLCAPAPLRENFPSHLLTERKTVSRRGAEARRGRYCKDMRKNGWIRIVGGFRRAWVPVGKRNPGRCPGLAWLAPLGRGAGCFLVTPADGCAAGVGRW